MRFSRRLLIAVYLGVLVLAHLGCDEMPIIKNGIELPPSPEVLSPPLDALFDVTMAKFRDDTESLWLRLYQRDDGNAEWKGWFEDKLERNGMTLETFSLETIQRRFYVKYVEAGGIAIVANDGVKDTEMFDAWEAILVITSKRPELRDRLQKEHGFYMTLLDRDTSGWDLPETVFGGLHENSCTQVGLNPGSPGVHGICYARLANSSHPDRLWIFVHEFAHRLDWEIERLSPGFQEKVQVAYETALKRAREENIWTRAITRHPAHEYFAEGVVEWFYHIGERHPDRPWEPSRSHATYEEFKEKDPLLYEILDEWFPKVSLLIWERCDYDSFIADWDCD